MPFSLKNHSVLSWNALLLLAAFLLAAGCGPASSGSGQSQPPAAAATQPAAETVTQGTGPVPETLWDKRADYEKEGQVVLFTDCGLYKGDTDELTGAKCEFKDGRWVLLEPKLEPKDNLIKNGDFSEWPNGEGPFDKSISHFIPGFSLRKGKYGNILLKSSFDYCTSKPYSLKIEMDNTSNDTQLIIHLSSETRLFLSQGGRFTFAMNTYHDKLSDAKLDLSFLTIISKENQQKAVYNKSTYSIVSDSLFLFSYSFMPEMSLRDAKLYIILSGNGTTYIDDIRFFKGFLPI